MKWVCKGAIPYPWLKPFCVGNLERLRELQSDTGSLPVCAREFSEIISNVRVHGFYKRTAPGRLIETERVIRKYAAETVPLRILDVGASDGVTTVQLVESLGRPCEALSMDRYQVLRAFKRCGWMEYRTTNGLPVLVQIWRLVLPLPASPRSRDFVRNTMAKLYMQSRKPTISAWMFSHEIKLVSPLALNKAGVEPVEGDILEDRLEWHGGFDVIRASNVINLNYFTKEERTRIVSLSFSYLKDQGVFVVSRNDDAADAGTIWKKDSGVFVNLEDWGGGSEIAPEV